MLEPRRLQGELRAPLWNPRHTGYVTPNAVHAFAARARDYAHGCRSCREKSLAPDHARFDSELASHRHPAIQATTTPRSAGVERSGECARGRPAPGMPRAAPHSDALQLQHAHRTPLMYQLRTVILDCSGKPAVILERRELKAATVEQAKLKQTVTPALETASSPTWP